jgi:hypothetical protein
MEDMDMANECSNYITIRGEKDLIQLFADSYLDKLENGGYGLDFNMIAPIPDNCEDDYEFRIDNWGNKWDGTNGTVEVYDDEIFIEVFTAWSPCEPITKKLINLCPGLYFYHEYYEPGDGFIGWIEHHPDEEPEDFEQTDYYYNDKENYWFAIFDKEYETFDWLYDHVNDMYEDEELFAEDKDLIIKMIEENEDLKIIVDTCIEKGVL